ncbi:MAG: methyltransferase [Rubinisphaera brasiliensis]|uniref:rRNA (Guanine-N(2)-)-methyltransferase n=1 Tax=Rubinisphaera brasiliensis (strain ATCC 49424 / DSM 5305 / JCM 21570 / IAM 15109 / NBRC 103401 / IFAM 1448) TaxID=756272 RepID=F0SL45_RUBBR|nr:methyltransferase [Rubinisphaera brasiliensis]ADY60928.1 rRNA (guanine-N(2)-)-methyltransferase [Rubinisphaera brasiliensis DSM 5305]MBR9801452.1 methyltransferase [bacterium]
MRRDRRKQQHQQDAEEGIPYIPPRPEEQLLIQHLASFKADRILCSSHGRGQLAGFLASQLTESKVDCHYFDTHYAELAREYWEDADHPPKILCQPDLPEETYDAICIPVHQQGNAELTRESLQQAYQRLAPRGQLIAAVNNPRDTWLNDQFKEMFPKVTRLAKKRGVIYKGKEHGPLKKVRDFSAEFEVPLADGPLVLKTRPGVFSHRRMDAGGWALIKALDVIDDMTVLDLGCGCGAVGLAAMRAAKNVDVTAIDSHARAIQCTEENAKRNLSEDQLARFTTKLTHTATLAPEAKFDIVAANPPYFSQYKIAELFINAAKRMIAPRGRLSIVTKMPHWYEEHLPKFFDDVTFETIGHYTVVHGRE